MKEKILERPRLFFSFVSFLILWISGTAAFSTSPAGSIFLIVIPVIVIIILVLLIFRGDKKYSKVFNQLHYHCLPEAFITEVRILLQTELEKETPKDIDLLHLYLSIGFYAAGKFEKAMETLEKIEVSRHHNDSGFLADYFHCRFLVSLETGRQDTAWDSLVNMREAVTGVKKQRELYRKMYDEDIHMLNVARGDYEGAEEVFKDMFERGQTNYDRSFASYRLGGVYKHLGKDTDAKDAYEYVLAWGNKLYIAGRSAEILGIKGWEP